VAELRLISGETHLRRRWRRGGISPVGSIGWRGPSGRLRDLTGRICRAFSAEVCAKYSIGRTGTESTQDSVSPTTILGSVILKGRAGRGLGRRRLQDPATEPWERACCWEARVASVKGRTLTIRFADSSVGRLAAKERAQALRSRRQQACNAGKPGYAIKKPLQNLNSAI
jgi:hypothetical protein